MILQNEDREWISRGIWNRIYRQYPSLLAENADRQGSYKESAKKSEICTDPQKLDEKSNDWRSVFLWLNTLLN